MLKELIKENKINEGLPDFLLARCVSEYKITLFKDKYFKKELNDVILEDGTIVLLFTNEKIGFILSGKNKGNYFKYDSMKYFDGNVECD